MHDTVPTLNPVLGGCWRRTPQNIVFIPAHLWLFLLTFTLNSGTWRQVVLCPIIQDLYLTCLSVVGNDDPRPLFFNIFVELHVPKNNCFTPSATCLKWHLTQIKVVEDGSGGHSLVYSNCQTYSLTGSRDRAEQWFQFVLANLSAVTSLSPSGSSYIPGLAHWPSQRWELSRKDKRVRVEKCMFVLVCPPVSRWPTHGGEKKHMNVLAGQALNPLCSETRGFLYESVCMCVWWVSDEWQCWQIIQFTVHMFTSPSHPASLEGRLPVIE